ncbi:TPA_asm: hypothetical protein GND82_001041 [Salmonella enterica subsp. salamae serovar 60:g,m,t:z6]|uniref:Uncharacterized protein n=1 Tax=Salmonella enterica subsp. houtenae serovar 1,40:z4,z32:- TaxID=1967604 RepID=A0A730WF60_SALHO|nr:hypothetical protein [Salmonella bongori serovar 66:z65:-]HAE2266207.1 hypothetical protein [Salmonella enterica subsp. enterica serovar 1,9,12:-:-]HAE4188494.1 hypothetical protein [Salmonella enterica subsp. houtenae serovar 1,40:z4,z32:-]HAE7512229.1 hypothetical protein [Salmonella enterica subsp. salamae serovar 60:g,m,t:z6]
MPFCPGQNENNSQHDPDASRQHYASSARRRIERVIRCKSDAISKPGLIQSLKQSVVLIKK